MWRDSENNQIFMLHSDMRSRAVETHPDMSFPAILSDADIDAMGFNAITDADLTQDELAQRIAQTQTTLIADFQHRIQQRLDDFAKTRNYDGILSAASYAVSSHPPFAAEGRYCADARDETWGACYMLLGEVEAGTRTISDWATLEALLPVLEWPE